jgi:hypothetical protein
MCRLHPELPRAELEFATIPLLGFDARDGQGHETNCADSVRALLAWICGRIWIIHAGVFEGWRGAAIPRARVFQRERLDWMGALHRALPGDVVCLCNRDRVVPARIGSGAEGIVTREPFMLNAILVALFVVAIMAGCGAQSKKDFATNFELDASSFDPDSLKLVGQRTGVLFPEGSRGLNIINEGRQIDPSFAAKLELPSSSKQTVVHQIEQFPKKDVILVNPLAKEVSWWRSSQALIAVERQYFQGENLVHAILCEENGKLILYLEWHSR